MTHICYTGNGSDNGSSPGHCQVVIRTKASLLSSGALRTFCPESWKQNTLLFTEENDFPNAVCENRWPIHLFISALIYFTTLFHLYSVRVPFPFLTPQQLPSLWTFFVTPLQPPFVHKYLQTYLLILNYGSFNRRYITIFPVFVWW